jgi:hypothetical protein
MPTKGAGDKAGSSSSGSSSFSLGDLQATLQQSAETREKLTASRDGSRGLFRSRSGKKEGSGLNLREEEGLAVGVTSGSEAGDAPRGSSSGSMRKGSFNKGLMGALKNMKHSFVSSMSVNSTIIRCDISFILERLPLGRVPDASLWSHTHSPVSQKLPSTSSQEVTPPAQAGDPE